jgi:hypothetical protein
MVFGCACQVYSASSLYNIEMNPENELHLFVSCIYHTAKHFVFKKKKKKRKKLADVQQINYLRKYLGVVPNVVEGMFHQLCENQIP